MMIEQIKINDSSNDVANALILMMGELQNIRRCICHDEGLNKALDDKIINQFKDNQRKFYLLDKDVDNTNANWYKIIKIVPSEESQIWLFRNVHPLKIDKYNLELSVLKDEDIYVLKNIYLEKVLQAHETIFKERVRNPKCCFLDNNQLSKK